MFKTTFIFSLLLTSSVCFSQKIYFAKDNYQDSNLLQTNIVGLAKQAIPLYKNDDQEKYLDNLFRLQLTANMYQETLSSLNALMHFYYGDSITPSVMGIAFQLYSATMKIDPPTHTFEEAYSKVFYDKYNSFNDYNKSLTIQYFVTPIEMLQKRLLAVIGEYQNKDSLSVYEAARLCRAYLGYKVYGKTQKIALKILNDIDHQKFVIEDSVLLKMPDGGTVSLAIVRNRKDTAPLPVVLMYNIYAGSEVADCKVAATRGYVGIVANTRGKRLSQDVIEPFENDAKDAYYIIDWISKQPWCNGKIGMYGGSYLGFSQWSATKKLHPALTTIVPQVSVGIGIDFPMHNNIFMSYMLRWIHNVTDIKLTDDIGFMDRSKWLSLYNQWYKSGRRFRSLDTLEGRGNTIFQRWLQHPSYDAYWQSMTPQKEAYANINIPILSITGYWDDDQTGALYYYHQHHQWNKNPHHYLLIGPYNHTGAQDYPNPVLYGYTIDSVANIPIIDLVYDWFGHTLKNGQRPAILKDKVNFQIMGKNEWRSVPTLSRMADDTLRLYLTNTRINKRYRLGITQPGAMGFVSQTIDFKDRSDSNTVELAEATDAFSIIEDSAKVITKDHLVFVSDPVEKPMAISGAILPTLLASINKRDMDFFVSLYEQTPDGKYVWLGKNAQRASYANDRTKQQLLTPYKIERLPITNTYMTCKQLQKGSRIVVVVGINKNRYWQINYGTGKDVSDETVADAGVPLQVKWHHGSCIEIPVLRR